MTKMKTHSPKAEKPKGAKLSAREVHALKKYISALEDIWNKSNRVLPYGVTGSENYRNLCVSKGHASLLCGHFVKELTPFSEFASRTKRLVEEENYDDDNDEEE